MLDAFDPNNWPAIWNEECRIYGSDDLSIYSVVDIDDYSFLSKWVWSPKISRGGKKVYLRRNIETAIEGGCGGYYVNPETGRYVRNRRRIQQTLFLHTVVMWRTGIIPPSKDHSLVDHLDGDGMNCRRNNLRWATHSMNSRNTFGKHAKEMELA